MELIIKINNESKEDDFKKIEALVNTIISIFSEHFEFEEPIFTGINEITFREREQSKELHSSKVGER